MKGIRLITLQLLITNHSQPGPEKICSHQPSEWLWSNSLNIHIYIDIHIHFHTHIHSDIHISGNIIPREQKYY